ncbi:PAS domain-containing sensor histidine kinase [Pelobium sp.]|nr:PAS domain-containing sensor histidine kinase [Pelobium sp.]MDA9554972.1 PAS domain-containing sensor histidine kinase [Pelobium sp.]
MNPELNHLRSEFFDHAEIQFMMFDKDLNIIDVNEVILKQYHLKREDLVGKHILEISPDAKEKGIYDKYKQVIETGKSIIIEESISHPKYGNRYNRVKAFKVGDGLGATASNITEFKNNIEKLELFSYKSSHDMRGPINNILGMTEIALNSSPDEETAKNYFSIIKKQAESLGNFLNALLETLKTQHSDNEIQVVNFIDTLLEVKKSLCFIDGFNDMRFEENINIKKEFYTDKMILISIFQNLIENAIKYRDREKENHFIKIDAREENGFAKITIQDNGIGISESAQKNIFKMFFRGTNQGTGTGLGLYNLRYAIEKLGGLIKFDSKENEGTIFTIYLPNKA